MATLSGGSGGTPSLYFSSANPMGYVVVAVPGAAAASVLGHGADSVLVNAVDGLLLAHGAATIDAGGGGATLAPGDDSFVNGFFVVSAAGDGNSRVDMFVAAGAVTLSGSLGHPDVFEIGAITAGAHRITVANWTGADSFHAHSASPDQSAGSAPTIGGADHVVTLNDGSRVTFTVAPHPDEASPAYHR